MEHQDNTTPEAARERTKQEIVKHFFPFVQPPDELIQGTYIIQNERLKLQSGYHQTSTGILLTQPPSGHILIPAAEIIKKIPILETQLIFRNELPITHQLGRPFAVW